MPRVAEKTARICQHADEAAEEPEIGERRELPLHRFLLVEEPPTGAELDFAGNRAVVEISDHRPEDVVVRRVQVVEDHAGQFAGLIQRIEITCQGPGLRKIPDAIEAAVAAHGPELTRVIAAERPEVQLLRPAPRGVPTAEFEHEVGAKFSPLVRRGGASGKGGVENCRGLGVRTRFRQRLF